MRYLVELKAMVDKDVLDKITEIVNDDVHDADVSIFTITGEPEPDEGPTGV